MFAGEGVQTKAGELTSTSSCFIVSYNWHYSHSLNDDSYFAIGHCVLWFPWKLPWICFRAQCEMKVFCFWPSSCFGLTMFLLQLCTHVWNIKKISFILFTDAETTCTGNLGECCIMDSETQACIFYHHSWDCVVCHRNTVPRTRNSTCLWKNGTCYKA